MADGEGGQLTIAGASHALWVPLASLKSKSNFRRQQRNSSWSRLSSFEDGVARLLMAVRGYSWPLGDQELAVASRPHVVASVLARTMLDAGNLSKSVLDAAQGVLYHTDASVRCVQEFAQRANRDQNGAVGFAVCETSTPTSAELLALSYKLSAEVLAVWDAHTL